MHTDSIDAFRHEHVFLGERHGRNERRTWLVIGICAAMMAAEIDRRRALRLDGADRRRAAYEHRTRRRC